MRAAKVIIVVAICFALVGQLRAAPVDENDKSSSQGDNNNEDQNNREKWAQFKQQFNKTYQSLEDDAKRFARFLVTLAKITAHNALTNSSFTMGLNQFADFYDTEIGNLFGNLYDNSTERWRQRPSNEQQGAPGASSLSASVDWRQVDGRVTGVKDQGQCGSCWAFATAGMLEGQDTGSNRKLSEQQLVDCSSSNYGCEGGWIAKAIDDLRSQNAGLETGDTYSYKETQNSCQYDSSRAAIGTPGEPMILAEGDEEALANWVANWGPVAVSFTASDAFQSYRGGIFSDPNCNTNTLNHAVLVVGYGSDEQTGMDYWIIKNSWDTTWGEQGFGRMQRGVNMCNIATSAVVIS